MADIPLAKQFLAIRQSLGLSQHDIAQIIGVSEGSIWIFENKPYQKGCNSETRKKIHAFMNAHHAKKSPKNDDVVDDCLNLDAVREKEKNEIQKLKDKIFHSFIHGRRYCIQEGKPNPYEFEFNPLNGKGCTFIYLRKEGRHHMFREERGGWTRTYTDNQLIGKYIKEA